MIAGMARLLPDGGLDYSYIGPDLSESGSYVNSIALQSDGKMIIGGEFDRILSSPRNRIARFNPDGTLDQSFGDGLAGPNATVHAVALREDGAAFTVFFITGAIGEVGFWRRGGAQRPQQTRGEVLHDRIYLGRKQHDVLGGPRAIPEGDLF